MALSPDDYRHSVGGRRSVSNASPVPISSITSGSSMFETLTGMPVNGLPVLNEASALTISAINACTNLIAGAIASMPVTIFARSASGERSKLMNDPLWWLLNEEFTPRWVASAGWDFLVRSRLFHGDGFAEILRRGSTTTGLTPLHPLRVQPVPLDDGSRLVYVIHPDSWQKDRTIRVIDQDDMLHVPGWGFDGCRSVSPLRYSLKMTGSVALATQNFSGQFFANQARPDYALKTEGNLTAPQISDLREQIDEHHSTARGKAGRPMLLQGGLSLQTVQLSNEDAELVATRGFQIEEIARAYGVPPFMIGHSEKTTSWGTGVEQMGAGFVRYTLRSHLNAFQNEINRKFFRTAARCAEFDTFELERGDMKSMFEALRIAVGRAGEPGWMTRNEARAFTYQNAVEGGDAFNEGISNDPQPSA